MIDGTVYFSKITRFSRGTNCLIPPPLGSAWKTESMVTPVFATPILTISGLA